MTAAPDGGFAFLTPAEIYDQLTRGRGPEPLAEAQQALYRETPEEDDRAQLIASIGDLIATGWTGKASDAAEGAALPLKEHVLANVDKLDCAQDLLSRQVGSFQRAYNSVRPVPDTPELSVDEPIPFDVDHAKAVAVYQALAQHNMDVFRDYDGASSYNETNMPQEFHAGGRDGGDVSVRGADTLEVGEPRHSGRGGPPEGPGVVSGEPRPGGGPGSGPFSGYHGGSDVVGGGAGGSQVSASGVGGGDLRPGSGYFPAGGGPSGGGASGGGASGGGFVGGVPLGGSPGGVGSIGGNSGGRASGGNPAGGSAGGKGAAGGPGGAAPRGGLPVRGPGGAVGAGALAAEESALRRGVTSGGAGRGGLGPAGGPVGGGRGQDDEDAEHQRKVLIEVDGEEIFGSDVLTAPSVIGDEEFED